MIKAIFYLFLLMLVFTTYQTSIVQATENPEQTANILNNSSFDNQTEDWETSGNVDYDGADYGQLDKSVRFSGSDGGSIGQTISLDIVAEDKIVDSVDGSFKSIGCNNIGNDWCTKTGTIDNLDTVDWELKFQDDTQLEIINFSFTSDYNDGTITQTFYGELSKEFNTDTTNLEIIVSGADTGDWAGQYGTIIDDLSLVLTLSDPIIPEVIETPKSANIEPTNSTTTVTTDVLVVDDINTGIIDVNMTLDAQIDAINSITVDLPQMDMQISESVISNEMPILVDDIEIPEVEMDMPEVEMDMPEIEVMPIEEIDTMTEEVPEEIKELDMEKDLELEPEEEIKEDLEPESTEVETSNNQALEEKVEKKTETEKNTPSNLENKGDKKEIETIDTPKIQSDIVIEQIILPKVISFSKEYFANPYKDKINLGTGVEFYGGQDRFNNQDYTQANINFFDRVGESSRHRDMVAVKPRIKIESYDRNSQ